MTIVKNTLKEKCFHSFQSFLDDLQVAIQRAEKKLAINVYIFEDDAVGRQVSEHLVAAAQRGVEVRLLVDGYGSRGIVPRFLQPLEGSGLGIRIYHPLTFQPSVFFSGAIRKFFAKLNKRDHKKLIIVDHEFYYVGSCNLCTSSFEQRETMVKTSNGLSDAVSYFEYTWNNAHKIDEINKLPFKIRKPRTEKFSQKQLLCNFNLKSRQENHQRLLESLEASRRVWLSTAYFVPPLRLLKALGDVAERGGDVRIMLPAKLDIPSMKIAALYFYPLLLRRGVKIFMYQDVMLHSKVTILEQSVLVGSSNLDHRSFFTNLEVDLDVSSKEARDQLVEQFAKDLENCKEITLGDLSKVPWESRLLSRLFYAFRRFL